MKTFVTRFIYIIISIILLIISLFLPAGIAGGKSIDTLMCFLLGWFVLFDGEISWLANPMLIISWFCLAINKTKISTITSLLAVLLSLSFLFSKEIILNEAGHKGPIESYGLGYFLWLASCMVILAGSLLILKTKNKKETDPYTPSVS
ncbi:hypothetical protein [Chryseobacterium sp.]|uniref:hypothetical protein n=1 Tax=Chryseobacterium sp. TaxID=1871047 RepID=UPI0025C5C51F|nr:hypothetical protein [Chryseobacterium sp.]